MLIKDVMNSVNEADTLGDSKVLKSANEWFIMVDNPHNEYFLEVRSYGLSKELVVSIYIDYKYDNVDKYSPDLIDISWGFSTEHHDPKKMITVLEDALKFKKTIEEYCKSHKN